MKKLIKKTKIVATIGPSSCEEETLRTLLDEGVDVIRLNFSHGSHQEHLTKLERWRKVLEEPAGEGRNEKHGAVLQDLAGPKIRIGDFAEESIVLEEGEEFTLTTEEIIGTNHQVYVNYDKLPQELADGDRVLLDDGKRELKVLRTTDTEVHCEVVTGGSIRSRRGVNLPGAELGIPALTDKDKEDVQFGIEHEVEFIALSFVRRAKDVHELRDILEAAGSDAHIISKIETRSAVDNFNEILNASDGIMVARGDLAVEISLENVPLIQKQIIKKCNQVGKPAITATQMLESMVENSTPTRAEISDVANSIIDGSDAVMLSGETALGKHPVEAVKMMSRVAKRLEAARSDRPIREHEVDHNETVDALTDAVVQTAYDLNAVAIVALTDSGFTAQMVARYKPDQPILAISRNPRTVCRMALSYGCIPVYHESLTSVDEMVDDVSRYLCEHDIGKPGDHIVITAGVPFDREVSTTNMLMIEQL